MQGNDFEGFYRLSPGDAWTEMSHLNTTTLTTGVAGNFLRVGLVVRNPTTMRVAANFAYLRVADAHCQQPGPSRITTTAPSTVAVCCLP